MTNFVDRLRAELTELTERTEALGRFFDTETYKALTRDERLLLCEQHAAMERYRGLLQRRVEFYESRPVHEEVG